MYSSSLDYWYNKGKELIKMPIPMNKYIIKIYDKSMLLVYAKNVKEAVLKVESKGYGVLDAWNVDEVIQ